MRTSIFLLAAVCTPLLTPMNLSSEEVQPAPPKFKWRVREGKVHVLWLGGGHWHDTASIVTAVRPALELENEYFVTYSEETSVLTRLQKYDVLVLNAMLGELAPAEEKALLEAVRKGMPLFVLHATSGSFLKPGKKTDRAAEHPQFCEMIGGLFRKHPPLGPLRVKVAQPEHPITAGMKDFEIVDEQFLFQNLATDNDVVLEAEHEGGMQPLAWTRKWGQGKVFHLALGHDSRSARNPAFKRLVVNGLNWLTDDPPGVQKKGD